MGTAADRLLAYRERPDCYTAPHAELRELQVAAMDERLQERRDCIKLVGLRVRDASIEHVHTVADIVPLLLPHTAYKSYPESFLVEEKWDKLAKWLNTVSAYPVDEAGLGEARDVDDWVERLRKAGHYVSCSSGTTGKSAMLIASAADMAWTANSVTRYADIEGDDKIGCAGTIDAYVRGLT